MKILKALGYLMIIGGCLIILGATGNYELQTDFPLSTTLRHILYGVLIAGGGGILVKVLKLEKFW